MVQVRIVKFPETMAEVGEEGAVDAEEGVDLEDRDRASVGHQQKSITRTPKNSPA